MGPDVSGFLTEMGRLSRIRAETVDEAALKQRVFKPSAPRPLETTSFGVIAEIKFSAPSAGILRKEADPIAAAVEQAIAYQSAGASAISVLTEPSRFSGCLEHLEAVASAVDIPVMRKDFLVDPIQVKEARAHGASGVLLIVRMLNDVQLESMVREARNSGMFVLLEAFDDDEIRRAQQFQGVLVGLNCRDLQTLAVEPSRFSELAQVFSTDHVRVAESGIADAHDIQKVVSLGYGMALVGSALMQSDDPTTLLRDMIRKGREET